MKDFMNNEWKSECIACEIGKGNIIPPGGIIKDRLKKELAYLRGKVYDAS